MIVAIAAAIGAPANQYDPVAIVFPTASSSASVPSSADIGCPFPIALQYALKSGDTPSGAQLPRMSSRNPPRTSSKISSAPCAVHKSRTPSANSRVGSS